MESYAKVRDIVSEDVRKYLLGPQFGNDEIIATNPKFTYMTGVLHPQDSESEQENHEVESGGDSDEETEKSIFSYLNQSSFGLSFVIKKDAKKISIRAQYGTYAKRKLSDSSEKNGQERYVFQRTHHDEKFEVEVSTNNQSINLEIPFGQIRIMSREKEKNFLVSVYMVNSFKTRNTKSDKLIYQPSIEINSPDKSIQPTYFEQGLASNEDRLFEMIFSHMKDFGTGHGCSVQWNTDSNQESVEKIWTEFMPEYIQKNIEPMIPDTNTRSGLDMKKLYEITEYKEYQKILFPIYQQYVEWINENLTKKINTVEDRETAERQMELCIDASKRILEGIKIISSDPIAGKAFNFMNRAMAIQRQCIYQSEENRKNETYNVPEPENAKGEWRIFQMGFILSNIKSLLHEKQKAIGGNDSPISEDDIRESRESADLLWFPTGGGKTEAYLGLIAFTIAIRRLSSEKFSKINVPDPSAYGVSVIMRYTLRLLTIQQFQRAASLMCSCEYIRRKDPYTWGTMPFLVGLWVGQNTTPNVLGTSDTGKRLRKRFEDKHSALTIIEEAQRHNEVPDSNNPMQLLFCPWCGKPLTPKSYSVGVEEIETVSDNGKKQKHVMMNRMRTYCNNKNCFFNRNNLDSKFPELPPTEVCIPIVTVDEDIYNQCPSLLISTIDKFAQITWNQNVSRIFGKLDTLCNKHGFMNMMIEHEHAKSPSPEHNFLKFEFGKISPPDLIVQDELHLISGPLGTLTALYENAIDIMTFNEKRNMRPKIIASTATIKSAKSQISSLFNRNDTKIFPPQGFVFGETFFSKVNVENTGKKFLGVSPVGRSQLTIFSMIGASLLRTVRRLRSQGISEEFLDPYYTLICYFNSKRELGGAYGAFLDTVPDYMQQIYQNVENKKDILLDDLEDEVQQVINNDSIETQSFEYENLKESKTMEEIFLQTSKNSDILFHGKELDDDSTSNLSKNSDENISDVVNNTVNTTDENKNEKKKSFFLKRSPFNYDELTSRKSSGEIPKILSSLEKTLSSKDVLDYLLCTNMIQVGVDVPRLGLMVVNGQPKNHSEYIQATGRIGRKFPGLIITMYNSLKPRDASHFENFLSYHGSFFKHVEPISLTPFASGTLDKGLFAICVGVLRNTIFSISKSPESFVVNDDKIKKCLETLKKQLSDHIDMTPEIEKSCFVEIDKLMSQWNELLVRQDRKKIVYRSTEFDSRIESRRDNEFLLTNIESGRTPLEGLPFVPNSLRDAEPMHKIKFFEFDENSDEIDLIDDDTDEMEEEIV